MYWVAWPTWHNKSVTGSCEGFLFSPDHGKSKDDMGGICQLQHEKLMVDNQEYLKPEGWYRNLVWLCPPLFFFFKLHEQTFDKDISLKHSWEAVGKFKGIRIIVLIYLLMEHVSLQNTAFENTTLNSMSIK